MTDRQVRRPSVKPASAAAAAELRPAAVSRSDRLCSEGGKVHFSDLSWCCAEYWGAGGFDQCDNMVVTTPLTVISFLQTLRSMAIDILDAKEQLARMPKKTKALIRQVEIAGQSLERLRPTENPQLLESEGLLRSCLDSLGEELLRAHEKVEKFQRNSIDTAERNRLWETGKAYFGLGAAKLNKGTEEIAAGIRSLLEELDRAITIEDHLTLARLTGLNVPTQGLPPHALVSKLEALASRNLDDRTCRVELEIAASHSDDFRIPGAEDKKVSREQGDRRGAREGGFEISNFTKIRFHIHVEEERFLNVIVYDNQQKSPPELFFPTSIAGDTRLSSSYSRQFPDNTAHKRDPLSLKLEKDATVSADAVVVQSIYVLLSPHELRSKEHANKFKLEDLGEYLEEHEDDDDVFVEGWK